MDTYVAIELGVLCITDVQCMCGLEDIVWERLRYEVGRLTGLS